MIARLQLSEGPTSITLRLPDGLLDWLAEVAVAWHGHDTLDPRIAQTRELRAVLRQIGGPYDPMADEAGPPVVEDDDGQDDDGQDDGIRRCYCCGAGFTVGRKLGIYDLCRHCADAVSRLARDVWTGDDAAALEAAADLRRDHHG